MKYVERMSLRLRDIVLAKLIGWVPTFAFSAALTLEFWRRLGFGDEQMLAIGLLQMASTPGCSPPGTWGRPSTPLTFLASSILVQVTAAVLRSLI